MKGTLYFILCMLMINGFSAQSKRAVGLSNRYTPSLEPVAESNAYNITVASDGTGDATTLQQAIDHVPQGNTHRFVIHIKPGTYKEQIKILHTQPYVTFRGEDPLKTTITFNLSARTSGDTRNSYTAYIGGNDFRAENITFENTYGTGSQAVAAYVNADRVIFRNCRFLGWQDTLFANGGRHYYKHCYIEGHVDFIFGDATAVFADCTIFSKGPGYITAQWRLSDSERNGFVLRHCKLTGNHTAKVYLGRPWRPYGRVVLIQCWMDAHIRPEGWDNWRDPAREKTAVFREYKSSGPGAIPSQRVAWSRQLNDREIRPFETRTFLKGTDNWNPYKW